MAPAVTSRLLMAYAGRRPPDRQPLQLAAHRVWLSPETVKTHV